MHNYVETFHANIGQNVNGKFNLRKDTIRAFFLQNQGTFFDFQKRAGEACPLPLSPLVTRLDSVLKITPNQTTNWLLKCYKSQVNFYQIK